MASSSSWLSAHSLTVCRTTAALRVLAMPMVVAGCATTPRFGLREPFWQDTDLEPTSVACRVDPNPPRGNPSHRLCSPPPYESSFAWDATDNLIFRPISRAFAADPGGEAINVNSLDEVPDSSWFVNRIGVHAFSPTDVADGYCGKDVLDPSAPDGTWTIDQGKVNGANPGFRVNVRGIGKFMLKADTPVQPERATAATSIATRLYYAGGWWTPCDSVVYFRPSILALKSGLTVANNSGDTLPFDEKALAKVLAGATHRGPLVRMVASRWLPGRSLGPFTYAGRNEGDPADVINHEDRRDLRGARLMAAWLGHFDSREQNTMSTWMVPEGADPDSSPGTVRHWIIDIGDAFGSEWDWLGISKRLNHAYYFDFGYAAEDFVTLGVQTRPWDRAARSKQGDIFGFFSSVDFVPEAWRGGYPNPAFNRMTERDAAWAARIIARFTPDMIEATVRKGDFTLSRHAAYLLEQLLIRQRLILQRYFSRLSPIADLVVTGSLLCGVDLARRTETFPAQQFHYSATLHSGPDLQTTDVAVALPGRAGRICVVLPSIVADGQAREDNTGNYLRVDLFNASAEKKLQIYLYNLGPKLGYRLVGLER